MLFQVSPFSFTLGASYRIKLWPRPTGKWCVFNYAECVLVEGLCTAIKSKRPFHTFHFLNPILAIVFLFHYFAFFLSSSANLGSMFGIATQVFTTFLIISLLKCALSRATFVEDLYDFEVFPTTWQPKDGQSVGRVTRLRCAQRCSASACVAFHMTNDGECFLVRGKKDWTENNAQNVPLWMKKGGHSAQCDPAVFPHRFQRSRYRVESASKRTWMNAKGFCEARGSKLAQISSNQERLFVRSIAQTYSRYTYIGFFTNPPPTGGGGEDDDRRRRRRSASSGSWRWHLSNEALDQGSPFWKSGSPDLVTYRLKVCGTFAQNKNLFDHARCDRNADTFICECLFV